MGNLEVLGGNPEAYIVLSVTQISVDEKYEWGVRHGPNGLSHYVGGRTSGSPSALDQSGTIGPRVKDKRHATAHFVCFVSLSHLLTGSRQVLVMYKGGFPPHSLSTEKHALILDEQNLGTRNTVAIDYHAEFRTSLGGVD